MARFIPTRRTGKDVTPSAALYRRLLSGQTVSAAQTGTTWQDLVAPAPAPTGGARNNTKHPSRKHDGPAPEPVYLLTNPASSRQARRAANRTAARGLVESQRQLHRDAILANRRTPAPSRAVFRWALKQPKHSELLAEVERMHASLAGTPQ
jgi:hypothetical protein